MQQLAFTYKNYPLRWFHLLIGIIGVIVFLNTGQYMDKELNHLRGMELGPRALYRSAHIYILFASLMHLLLGAYLQQATGIIRNMLQYAASLMIVIALGLFIYSFYTETNLQLIERPNIRLGIYLSAASTITHVIVALAQPTLDTKPEEAKNLHSSGIKKSSASITEG